MGISAGLKQDTETATTQPAPAELLTTMADAMAVSSMLTTAAHLGLADEIGPVPVAADRLAAAVGAQPEILFRLMRALATVGVFRDTGDGRFAHTDLSRALRDDGPLSLRHKLLTSYGWGWEIWGGLTEAVRTGQCAFEARYGKDLFAYFEENPEAQARCYQGVTAWADEIHPRIAGKLHVPDGATVADLGGGNGDLLRVVLERHPQARGILFETESTLRTVIPELRDGPLAERVSLVAGDFLDDAACPADIYLIKMALHMWDNDEACVRILSNCAKAAPQGARIVILERLVRDTGTDRADAIFDLHMFLVSQGRERTEADYARLLAAAGFTFTGSTGTGTPIWLIEGHVRA